MEYPESLDDLTSEQRLKLLLSDSTKYVRLMTDSDIDRLLANLAKRPIREHTKDHQEILEISRWYQDRYPRGVSQNE